MSDDEMQDAPQEQYIGTQYPFEHDDDTDKFPSRPRNDKETLYFHQLYMELFEPLLQNRKKATLARNTRGLKPHEIRRQIIDRFIHRWRTEVGPDIYPAFRLILPDKDKDRTVYRLKEAGIAKLFVKVMRIDKNSPDGIALINWKQPGQRSTGDFAGRCYEIIKKRPMRTDPGTMTIAEVNTMLDKLAAAPNEKEQYPIIKDFYNKMNPEELMWLIRIILKQMKVGATEKTFFDAWHPDAEGLFNISSQLKRVCWELWNPEFRLGNDDKGVTLMSCFQPQLAQFQKRSLDYVVKGMNPQPDDDVFWIEEKLDGERMQLHFDNGTFKFWSRKAKDYTHLYGEDFHSGSLAQFLKSAFNENVKSIILDGEMIEWNPVEKAVVGFGTLKTAANQIKLNPEDKQSSRPVLIIFDILYLNGTPLTNYTLRDRRRALEKSVREVDERLLIHKELEARDTATIESELRKVIDAGAEGLVIKNPRSMYRLNDRNDDWIKVKPEYMTEFGEEFDIVILGGYYGQGRRGGILSSYLCGLRVDDEYRDPSEGPMFYSFCKVGGGFKAEDYKAIRHNTEGKWQKWDPNHPPLQYMELAGQNYAQFERPDVWIRPEESLVIAVKGAQVTVSNQFRVGKTLRFPRFKGFKNDKTWREGLTISEFNRLKDEMEQKIVEAKMEVERKRQVTKRRKRDIMVLGQDDKVVEPYAGPKTDLFAGYSFFVVTESRAPERKSKAEIEQLIKAHGGKVYQSESAVEDIKIIAERVTVKVAGLKKKQLYDVIRPSWIFESIQISEEERARGRPGGFVLPLEPAFMLHTTDETEERIKNAMDEYGDSYTRNVTAESLLELLDEIPDTDVDLSQADIFRDQLLVRHGEEFQEIPGWIFLNALVYLDTVEVAVRNKLEPYNNLRGDNQGSLYLAKHLVEFGGGKVTDNFFDPNITHVVVGKDKRRLLAIRQQLQFRGKVPRVVSTKWVEESIENGTLLDEERFVVKS